MNVLRRCRTIAFVAVLLAPLTACQTTRADRREAIANDFFNGLTALCGRSFAGRIVADWPQTPNDPYVGRPLVMQVRECSRDEIRIPFHVGDDRSRTWVITRQATGLRLKHDHRRANGAPDPLTQYGGDSSVFDRNHERLHVDFPADTESRKLFRREGRDEAVENTWAMELEPGKRFLYELARPKRVFRIEFDLTRPVADPPAPWGADKRVDAEKSASAEKNAGPGKSAGSKKTAPPRKKGTH